MKFAKKIFLLFLVFSLCSCASQGFLPGEKTVILRNLSSEYFNIAENYLAQKNYSKAIENYLLCLRTAQKENTNQVNFQLARAYALNKNYENAENIFLDLLKSDQNNTILKESLAFCYAKNGKISESIDLYKELYKTNTFSEEIVNNYVLVLLEGKKIDEANQILSDFKLASPDSKIIESLESKIKKYEETELNITSEVENKDAKNENISSESIKTNSDN